MNLLSRLAAAAALTLTAVGAHAATVTLNSFDNGWYSTNVAHTPSNTNTITGLFNGGTYRSFYAFNLPAVAAGQTILSATLNFAGGNGNNIGQNAQKHLGLFDYTGSIDALLNGSASGAFADLGTGASYGTTVVGGLNAAMPSFSVQLTGAALADMLNIGNSRFVIGASLLDPLIGTGQETLWSSSSFASAATLTLVTGQAVPEPDSIALLGAAALAFGIVARRRKAK